jgi:hypothetical protein
MGFDQDKTVHHFCTSASGGSIEVEVKDAADTVSLAQVRAHLEEIAAAFTHGDFARPMQTHAEVPPGVPVMERLKSEIVYRYAPMAKGGAVTIQTRNKEALAAIHEFLQYQTREHHTR